MTDIGSHMRRTLNRELLKYAAGRKIFCDCGSILDWKTVVLLTAVEGSGLKGSVTLCKHCWPAQGHRWRRQIEAGQLDIDCHFDAMAAIKEPEYCPGLAQRKAGQKNLPGLADTKCPRCGKGWAAKLHKRPEER